MRNDLPFFSHDNNARLHPKMKALISQYGPAGYGCFWMLNERISQADHARLDISKKITRLDIAGELRMNLDELDAFIAFLSDPEIDLISVEVVKNSAEKRDSSAEESQNSAEVFATSVLITTDRTQADYSRVQSERERKKDNGKNSAEKRKNSAEKRDSSAEKTNRAEQSRAEEDKSRAEQSNTPAACVFANEQEIKTAVQAAPFAIRLTGKDLEDVARRFASDGLGVEFVEYAIRRAKDPTVHNPGAFARSALLGSGAFSAMPDEYRAEIAESSQRSRAEIDQEPPPVVCDDCGSPVRHLPSAGEAYCTNGSCGASWSLDREFDAWIKSAERAVPVDLGAIWKRGSVAAGGGIG